MNSVFETALEIAVKAHEGQVDKNGMAYNLYLLADLANNTDPKRASGLNEARQVKYGLAKRVLSE